MESVVELLRDLFHWVEAFADTPYGVWALALVAFAESSFFPVPPDVLLIALCLGRPELAFFAQRPLSAGSGDRLLAGGDLEAVHREAPGLADERLCYPARSRFLAGGQGSAPGRRGGRVSQVESNAVARMLLSGRVQGVGFRYFTRQVALELGLVGWVRNLPDGNVEVRAAGRPAALESLRRRLRQGPPGSRVEGIEQSTPPAPAEVAEWSTFEIRY